MAEPNYDPAQATVDNPFVCVLDPETWLTGEGTSASFLLRASDDKMCCIGQLALKLGIPRNELLHKKSAESWLNLNPVAFQPILRRFAYDGDVSNSTSTRVYSINDFGDPSGAPGRVELTHEARVAALNKELAEQQQLFRFALSEMP